MKRRHCQMIGVLATSSLLAAFAIGCAGEDGRDGTSGEAGPPGPPGPGLDLDAGGEGGIDLSIYGGNAQIASWFSPNPDNMGTITGSAGDDAGPPGPYDLWKIQPGLGTVMMEYRTRMNNLWFAVHPPTPPEGGGTSQPNWDMAGYQVGEMREIQEVGEITRPKRKTALMTFESTYLDPLDADIKAKNLTQFETDYASAIKGCNTCHANQTTSEFPDGLKFIKIMMPTAPDYHNVDWNGQ